MLQCVNQSPFFGGLRFLLDWDSSAAVDAVAMLDAGGVDGDTVTKALAVCKSISRRVPPVWI